MIDYVDCVALRGTSTGGNMMQPLFINLRKR